ncbi:hypothetical protein PIB30_075266 [Stylosanthes scabra]|uniref:Uncharacterized protein n=1 Tax=Stylosanthes scabra TaxID=79078 RepID=A0ABU6RQD1_9FABA|nr:hypothetical protein [Stylosanthes scabra]
MAIPFHGHTHFVLLLSILALTVVSSSSSWSPDATESISPILSNDAVLLLNRSSFPAGFIFGTGSSSYQYDGAANEGGKGPSTLDILTHKHSEKIKDRCNGDVAVDQYHRYKEDVGIMKYMNTDAYRFSIAQKDFEEYSELCFKEFGDRVKHWFTFNEPSFYSTHFSDNKPYIIVHNQLLAHAAAVQIYRAKCQVSQKGLIGITLVSDWYLPYSNNNLDILAAQRS